MRRLLLATALVVPLGLPAWAQDQPTPPVPVPEQARPEVNAPLTTGTQPADIPTTTPQRVNPGLDGDAPADEIPVPTGQPRQATDGGQAPGAMPMGTPPAGATTTAGVPEPATPLAALSAVEAQRLVGQPVLSRDGEPVGTVRDFLTPDGNTTAVRALILGQGGVLGRPDRLVEVPGDQADIRPHSRAGEPPTVTLGLTAAEVESREAFTYGGSGNALVGPGR